MLNTHKPDQSLKLRPSSASVARWGPVTVLLGYLMLTLGMTYPLVTQFARAIPGDGFDGWQNYWNLWWVKVALLEQYTHPWFTNLLYHPTGVGLLFHTLNGFNGITFLPVQIAWGLLPAYNAVVVFSFAVGGLGAYLLARHVLGPDSSRLAAFCAGLIFTFSPYHVAHLLGHMQLISLEWIPFYVLYLLRTVAAAHAQRPARVLTRNALLAALFLVLVTLCDWYYLMYCLIFTGALVAWLVGVTAVRVIRERRASARMQALAKGITTVETLWLPWNIVMQPWVAGAAVMSATREHHARRLALAALRGVIAIGALWLVWAAAMSPWLLPMVREARQFDFMVPDPNQSRILSADLLAFVTPQAFHPLWGAWARERGQVFTSTVSEYTVFAGFTALALAGLGLGAAWGQWRKRVGRPQNADRRPPTADPNGMSFWLALLVFFLVLALGPVLHIGGRTDVLPGGRELPLLYGLLARIVPFMEITRSVSRFDIMAMLALGVLAAAGADWLTRRGRGGRVLAGIAAALILFEFLPAPYPMSPPDTPAWYSTLATDPRPGGVLNLPLNWDRPGYLLYQTEHGKPLTAAYISREDPRTLVERAPVLQHFRHLGPDILAFNLARQGQQALSDLDVRWVVLDRYKMPGGPEREITEAFAAEIFGGQAPSYADERLTVYEVQPPTAAAPYLLLGVGWEPFDKAAGTRAFVGEAPLLVQAPTAGPVTLSIALAPGSAALALPRAGDAYVQQVAVQAGRNEIVLRTAAPGERAIVSHITLQP